MKLRKWRDDDKGITYRQVSMIVGGRKLAYSIATCDELPRGHVARAVAVARKAVRDEAAKVSASS